MKTDLKKNALNEGSVLLDVNETRIAKARLEDPRLFKLEKP